jgi:tetratricopeptide (TPR) repeat protein
MELTLDEALQKAVEAHKEEKLEEAERLYRAILQSQPLHPDANHNLGVIAVSVNKAEAALPLFKTALEANPKIEQFWLSYIDALIKEKQFDNAKQVLEQSKKQGMVEEKLNILEAKLSPETQIQNVNSANPPQEKLSSLFEYYQNGQYGDAEKLAISITQECPNHPLAWKALGAILGQIGKKSEAIKAYQRVLQLVPQDAESHNNLGIILKELGRLGEAEASLKQAIALKIDYAEAHSNLGNTLKELGRLEEAESSHRQAIVLKPDYAEPHNNLGVTLQKLGRLDEAEESCRQAIVLIPDFAEAHNNLGNALKELGRLEESEASYTKAIKIKPDYAEAFYNLSFTHLLRGSLEKGFSFYESRLRKKELTVAPARTNLIWDGEKSLSGKHFVIYAEQGLGDIIQFCRYIPLLEQKGADITFKVRPNLHALLQTMDSNSKLVTSLPEENEIDFETPLMSVPHLLNTSLETIPAAPSYLFADQEKIQTWGERISTDRFKVGICWQGSKSNGMDFFRSFPLSLFAGISRIPNVELISLHKGEGEAQMAGIDFDVTALGHDFDAGQDAFLDTAAVMMNCDLIITACTSVAHLAGAIGRPTWVALKQIPDWRWMLDRPDSPWYPTMTLYRQKSRGDWVDVFDTIEWDLRSLLQQKKEVK